MPELEARYNIAPGQANPIIHATAAGYQLGLFQWGLVPHWLKEPKTQYSTINAKVETVADKPFYRDAFRQRRCLVPADGYYEWRKTGDGKQPYYIHQGGELFAFAGLWETWAGDGAEPFESYTIITGPAAEAVADLHPRMPLALPERVWSAWLDPATSRAECQTLLEAPITAWHHHPISTRVNNPRNDSPDLVQPQGAPGGE
ncbi:putative SOS response-associated peptidase YedK [Methylohalomonas lacus]|uniref:Abasic site processing protein n=1 Tax=Methylohalomonas lacus TaxID=398773 RepID=A0AAE3L0L2_9GAMM|nr:putative SOS response-associated peptidase YedK [Methylohalomonas lacus]